MSRGACEPCDNTGTTSTSFNMSVVLSRKWDARLRLLNANDPLLSGCTLAALALTNEEHHGANYTLQRNSKVNQALIFPMNPFCACDVFLESRRSKQMLKMKT